MRLPVAFLLAVTTLCGQLLYDYLSPDITGDIIRKNDINSGHMLDRMITQQLAIQAEIGRLNLLMLKGQQRLAEGKGSTTFQPSPSASFLQRFDPPQRPAAQKVIEGFEAAMRDKRFRSHDLADAQALSFVLAYYGLRGEDPGPARLEKLRAAFRQQMMADHAFQGLSDPERQQRYERAAYLSLLASALRNQAQRAASGPERDLPLQRAQQSAAAVLRDLYSKPVEGIELTPDGFGDRGERLAGEGGGNVTFRRAASSRAADHFDSMYGRGYAARLLSQFAGLVRRQGGSENNVADSWATSYAGLLHFAENGNWQTSSNGWQAARDYLRRWAQANPGWMRTGDSERQETCDTVALELMRLFDQREANRREMAQPPPTDPIKRALWVKPSSNHATLAEKAQEILRNRFVAAERPRIEALLRR